MSLAIVTGANRNPGIGYEIVRGLSSRLPTGSKAKRTNKRGVLNFYYTQYGPIKNAGIFPGLGVLYFCPDFQG